MSEKIGIPGRRAGTTPADRKRAARNKARNKAILSNPTRVVGDMQRNARRNAIAEKKARERTEPPMKVGDRRPKNYVDNRPRKQGMHKPPK